MEVVPFITSYLLGKSLDIFAGKFKVSVIERWTTVRAKVFLEEFYKEFALLNDILKDDYDKINSLLDSILKDEGSTELLFDVYRSVSLSKSKIIGPKLIGIITARCINEERELDEYEEEILSIVGNCNDSELIAFEEFVSDEYKNAINSEKKGTFIDNKNIRINWMSDCYDPNMGGSKISVAPLNLVESLGRWSRIFQDYGIILTDVTEEHIQYYEDSERYIDEDGEYKEVVY